MKIFLKNLKIKNFKGIKDISIDFSKETNIFGDNGIGKTTIHDSFTFLLFDKDSEDKTKFDIQPLDKNNNRIHHLETEIEGILLIDNQEVTLRKIYKEKWVKPKGKLEEELRGNETLYYIDEIPQKQKEYKKYISSLIDENLFKLITNPSYFTINLDWQKRREILINIGGEVKDLEVIKNDKNLKPIEEYLNQNKKIDDIKSSINGKIKKLKKDREKIPVRIDELSKSIIEYNFEKLKETKKNIEQEIDFIDSKILDKSKVSEVLLHKKEQYFDLKNKYNEKMAEAKEENIKNDKTSAIKREIFSIKNLIKLLEKDIESQDKYLSKTEERIKANNETLDLLRNEHKEIRNRKLEIDENNFICPTCKRKFNNVDIQKKKKEIEGNFNSKKAEDIRYNEKAGIKLKEETDKLKEETKIIKNNIDKYNKKIDDNKKRIKELEEEKLEKETSEVEELTFEGKEDLISKINALAEEIHNFKKEDTSILKESKAKLQSELKEINKQLAKKEINTDTKKRIEELEEEEKALSVQIAQLEQKEILCQDFIRAKVNLLENKINSLFKYVKFRFGKEYNSGGIEEDCEPLVDGIPFGTNLNNAAKINAGIDIINTLCNYYNINAPIFIDNRESVNDLIESDSQIINLIVSKDESLRIVKNRKFN